MERRAPDGAPPADGPLVPNGVLFWLVAVGVFVVDVVTKAIATATLQPELIPHPVIGEVARFTLVHNRGAAFGIHVGDWSRPIFSVLTVGALMILWRLYRATVQGDRRRTLALALVSAGAVGNLFDRVRSARGVVDFIDLGTGGWRWPTFNVADIAVTTGAVLLATVLWREDRMAAREAERLRHDEARVPLDAAPALAVTSERGGAV